MGSKQRSRWCTVFYRSGQIFLSGALIFGFGCRPNPVTGEKELALISENREVGIGNEHYLSMQQVQGGALTITPVVASYVDQVGQKLASLSERPGLPYSFVVLNNSTPNAWALPGGKIAITRGLLLQLENEAELAAVLSHEIVHTAARHGAKAIERGLLLNVGLAGLGSMVKDQRRADLLMGGATTAMALISTKYSRDSEREADKYAVRYLYRAGYHPQAAVSLQEKFVKLDNEKNTSWLTGLFATHPPSQERVEAYQALLASMDPAPSGKLDAEQYQKIMSPLKETKEAYQKLDDGYNAYVRGNLKQALTLAEEGLEAVPHEAHFWGLIGKIQSRSKDYSSAIESFDNAIKLNGKYFDFFLQRGLTKVKTNDREGARKDLQESLKLLPTAQAHHLLGHLDSSEKERHSAIDHFRQAGESDSPIGLKSREMAAKLELHLNPKKQVHLSAGLDRFGFLVLRAQNNSPITVHHMSIVVDVRDKDGQIRASKLIRFPDMIPSGKYAQLATGLGPFDKDSNLEGRVSAEIATLKTRDDRVFR